MGIAEKFNTAEAFQEHIFEVINHGAQAVMLSIGHQSGLLDCMAAETQAMTSQQLADVSGLVERYVREWLAAMTTAGIVVYQADTQTYWLPEAHADNLTRSAFMGNASVYAQFVAMMGKVEKTMLQCLKEGEGTRYEDYPCFHRIMSEDSSQSVVSGLFDSVLPLIPGIESKLESGIKVMDAGCGSGKALLALAVKYPRSEFFGYDLCEEAISLANQEADSLELGNIHFIQQDLYLFNQQASYDLVMSFDAVHDQKDPQGLLKKIYQTLKPEGVYLMQDTGGSAHLENNLDFPLASFLYSISFFHCVPVSIGQGGKGLGTMWGWETAKSMLENAGFKKMSKYSLAHDPMNVWFVANR